MGDGDDREGKEKKPPFKLTERELIENGGFIREIDEAVKIDRLNDRVDVLVSALNRYGERFDRAEEKFDTRIANVTDKISNNNSEFEHVLAQLRIDVTRLEAQVKVLLDLKEADWLTSLLKLIENKTVQTALLLLAGFAATTLGPEFMKMLLRLLGG